MWADDAADWVGCRLARRDWIGTEGRWARSEDYDLPPPVCPVVFDIDIIDLVPLFDSFSLVQVPIRSG